MTVLVLRSCPAHGPQSSWIEAWVDPDEPRRGREFRCEVTIGSFSERTNCDLILGRPTEYVPLEATLAAVVKAAARTATPRLIRDQVERELRRRRRT